MSEAQVAARAARLSAPRNLAHKFVTSALNLSVFLLLRLVRAVSVSLVDAILWSNFDFQLLPLEASAPRRITLTSVRE